VCARARFLLATRLLRHEYEKRKKKKEKKRKETTGLMQGCPFATSPTKNGR
jgi:hypothetical protein